MERQGARGEAIVPNREGRTERGDVKWLRNRKGNNGYLLLLRVA